MACVQLQDETSADSSRRLEIVLEARQKGIRPEKERRFVHMYVCCSGYLLAMGIGLDWIAASAVQTLKTSMWVGLSRSCFKLKLHFPVHHVRPATIYSYAFPLGCIFCPYRAYKWYSRVYPSSLILQWWTCLYVSFSLALTRDSFILSILQVYVFLSLLYK